MNKVNSILFVLAGFLFLELSRIVPACLMTWLNSRPENWIIDYSIYKYFPVISLIILLLAGVSLTLLGLMQAIKSARRPKREVSKAN